MFFLSTIKIMQFLKKFTKIQQTVFRKSFFTKIHYHGNGKWLRTQQLALQIYIKEQKLVRQLVSEYKALLQFEQTQNLVCLKHLQQSLLLHWSSNQTWLHWVKKVYECIKKNLVCECILGGQIIWVLLDWSRFMSLLRVGKVCKCIWFVRQGLWLV